MHVSFNIKSNSSTENLALQELKKSTSSHHHHNHHVSQNRRKTSVDILSLDTFSLSDPSEFYNNCLISYNLLSHNKTAVPKNEP